MTNFDLVLKLFLQLAVILAACRIVGFIGARFLGQTQVVSEMLAGVLLGPSLLGLVAPGVQSWLFPVHLRVGEILMPHPSMSILYALAQLGLVLYMFVIGLELDLGLIRERKRAAAMISSAGIVAPFILGGLLALVLVKRDDLFSPGVSAAAAVLYLGASMSITAFPMLARILYEQGLARTRLGTTALAAGSIDDAIAWCLLALVVAVVRSSPLIAWLAIGGAIVYGALMILVERPAATRLVRKLGNVRDVSPAVLSGVMLAVIVSAWVTDALGIYAVFGAFLAGVATPRGALANLLEQRIGTLATSLLLPVFFVYSGLNTRLDLVKTPGLWLVAAVIIAAAIAGKGLACTAAARFSGFSWKESGAIGTLMNARGLMELIILDVGLEKGVITPTLFTIMVMMAIVTTLMASPVYRLFAPGIAGAGAR